MAVPPARDPEFDARWSAWLARGAAHDRAVRRRLIILGPAVLIAAAVAYLMFIR